MIGLVNGKRKIMPRPNKLNVPTKCYNLLFPIEQWDKLAKMAHERAKTELEQVSVADLIRDAVDLYIHVIEQEDEDEKTGTEG